MYVRVQSLLDFSKQYNKRLEEEDTKTPEEVALLNVCLPFSACDADL